MQPLAIKARAFIETVNKDWNPEEDPTMEKTTRLFGDMLKLLMKDLKQDPNVFENFARNPMVQQMLENVNLEGKGIKPTKAFLPNVNLKDKLLGSSHSKSAKSKDKEIPCPNCPPGLRPQSNMYGWTPPGSHGEPEFDYSQKLPVPHGDPEHDDILKSRQLVHEAMGKVDPESGPFHKEKRLQLRRQQDIDKPNTVMVLIVAAVIFTVLFASFEIYKHKKNEFSIGKGVLATGLSGLSSSSSDITSSETGSTDRELKSRMERFERRLEEHKQKMIEESSLGDASASDSLRDELSNSRPQWMTKR